MRCKKSDRVIIGFAADSNKPQYPPTCQPFLRFMRSDWRRWWFIVQLSLLIGGTNLWWLVRNQKCPLTWSLESNFQRKQIAHIAANWRFLREGQMPYYAIQPNLPSRFFVKLIRMICRCFWKRQIRKMIFPFLWTTCKVHMSMQGVGTEWSIWIRRCASKNTDKMLQLVRI